MSRHRAYSDPASPTASPSLPSSSRLPPYASLLQQTQQLALDDREEDSHYRRYDYGNDDDYTSYTHHAALSTYDPTSALTEASLAAHSRPNPSPRPDRTKYSHPYSYNETSYPAVDHYGYPRQSATPSTTSVSDGVSDEEEEGYVLRKEDKAVVVGWLDRKGKGKAREVGDRRSSRGTAKVVEDGKGVAGSLPEEVLMHIFRLLPTRNLPAVMLVSRTWCLSAFPLMYARPTITSVSQYASFCRLLITDPSVLSLPYHTQIRRMNFNLIASDLPSELFVPLKVCVRMERITMVGCRRVSAAALRTVLDAMPELVALDMANSDAVDDSVLKVLGRRCPRLQGLNLTGCKSVGDEGVKAIARGCRMLRRMKIAECHRITDDSIIHLARLCPLILELDIADLPQLRDISLYAVWLNSIHLKELKAARNANFTGGGGTVDLPALYHEPNDSIMRRSSAAWVTYLEKHPDLFSRKSAEGEASNGGEGGHSLRTASAISSARSRTRASTVDSYIDRERDKKFDLTLLRPLAPSFYVLRVVDFTSCTELDDLTLVNLVRSAPKLRMLTLAKCSKIGDEGLEAVARLGKHLQHLHLGHLTLITDVAITKIARHCPRLRYLDVACCPLLTDLSVFELSSNLLKLRRIGLVKVVNLTDEAIYALAERHPSLEKLHLSYCDNISVRAITFMINRMMSLSHLSLTGVKAFKNEEMQRFRKDVPAAFNEHQAASFCVYSYRGINALRNYLNAQQLANNGGCGSDASTRRGSGSSDSSLNIPAYGQNAADTDGVWVGPAYHGRDDRLSRQISGTWGLAPPALDARRFEGGDTSYRGLGGLARIEYTQMDQEEDLSAPEAGPSRRHPQAYFPRPSDTSPRFGDQVYRRVSTPTLPVPPSVRVASGSSGAGSIARPRGPRESASGRASGITVSYSTGREGHRADRRDEVNVPIQDVSGQGRSDQRRGNAKQRIPGEYPVETDTGPERWTSTAGRVWGPEGGSGMVWSYGYGEPVPLAFENRRGTQGGEERSKRRGNVNRADEPERPSAHPAAPSTIPAVSAPSPPPPLGRYRASTVSSRIPPAPAASSNSRSHPHHQSSNIQTVPGGHNTRSSTGNIYDFASSTGHTPNEPTRPPAEDTRSTAVQPQAGSISSYLTQGRERGGSVSNALTDLAGRLRRPSLSVAGVGVGEVGNSLRWVAEMVGWTGEDPAGATGQDLSASGSRNRSREQGERSERRKDEGPRGERR